jgi:hypothetical protein
MGRIARLLVAALSVASPAFAQFEECNSYKEAIQHLTTTTDATVRDTQSVRLVDVGQTSRCFAAFVMNESVFEQFVRRLESSRTDKELTTAEAGTGTSIVSQGPAAKVLSAAVEHGALTRSIDGQVVTLRGNLAGFPSALARKNVFPYCPAGITVSEFCVENSLLSWLRRTSFSVSFDTSRGTQVTVTPDTPGSTTPAQPVTFTADKNQVSAASARVEVWNRRDVTSPAFQQAFSAKVGAALDKPSAELLAGAGTFAETVITTPGYDEWRQRTAQAIREAAPDRRRIIAVLRMGLAELVAMARTAQPDLDRLASTALAAYSRFFLAQDDLIASLATKNVIALEFTLSRPTGQPATRNYRGILDLPLTNRTKVVANVAFTFYDTLPEGAPADMSKYRDAQAGAQVEHGLGPHSIIGPAVLSLALYYQYQHAPSLLTVDPTTPVPGVTFFNLPEAAKTVFATKGNIVLGQAKLSVMPDRSSVKIPLSVTFSNRTELVDKPTWKAQVGVTYDFDSLLGAVRSARAQ